jgi:hypothetical protein
MDIATLLESHRRYMLAAFEGAVVTDIASAHDRATAKALLDMHRTATSPPAEPLAKQNSNAIRPRSKAARARALKASETRRANLLAKTKAQPSSDRPVVEDGGPFGATTAPAGR